MIPFPSPELIARHSVAGPRYTSYPAATEWTPAFGERELHAALAEANSRADEPISVYVHVPFCAEMCRFCGCNVIATKDRSRGDEYLDVVEKELALWAAKLPNRRRLAQLHLGGGTPTFLTEPQLERLHRLVTKHFTPIPGAELALEADPAITSAAQLKLLARLGFKRLSVGVQDLDPQVQQAINRIQTEEDTRDIIQTARDAGFEGVNVDLMYGLPYQTPDSYAVTIDRILAMKPDRLALFGYAHVPWAKPHQKLLPQAHLPGPELRTRLFLGATRQLEAAGYRQIGLDHFARDTDTLAQAQIDGSLTRNFQGYSIYAAPDTVAVGVSSISDIGGAFAQNVHKLSDWQALVEAGKLPLERGMQRSSEDELRGDFIRTLMCLLRLDRGPLVARHGARGQALYDGAIPKLKAFADDGIVALRDDGFDVTPLGRLFLRNVAMVFDGYLPAEGGSDRKFSKTV